MKNENNLLEIKRGYLNEDFKFFHLKDQKNMQFEYHYHDFDKILIFISGKVTYLIEGKAYKLRPWDIILVNHQEIHKPIIDPNEVYERIVIWVNSAFLDKHSSDGHLATCFEVASANKYNLLRLEQHLFSRIQYILLELEKACICKEFGSRILQNALFMQFAVHLNREFLHMETKNLSGDIEYDEVIEKVLDFINHHLQSDLSIDRLASKFYISKYYLMRRFKSQTGYSIHQYILQKRLMMSHTLIKQGQPATEVSIECGFGDYSNFVRAFKKMFGLSPKKYYKSIFQLEKSYHKDIHF